ncbi:MAG: SDR family NAD(P)-dependent oxidoreductase [Nostoc sp. SerVER01]|nr:SDR family NAD(P)-dependent oxidoreductase [Nostoc sp. SerVER01]MDZ8072183.1 SDR family NAD(P)-dependent oxidoreductase [Nostoc sp. DedQUE01]
MTSTTENEKFIIPDVSDRPLPELISLKNKVAVVTGGSKGIGWGICKRLAEAGANVVVAGHHQESSNQAAAELTNTYNNRAISIAVDVSNSATLSTLAERTISEFGRLDIWVNNAAIFPIKPLLEFSDEAWQEVINVDLNGVFFGSREAAKRMIAAGNGGVIINLSSVLGYKAWPKMSAYVCAKHGIGGLTKSLAIELGQHGIRVLAIAPSVVKTAYINSAEFQDNSGVDSDEVAKEIPLGRVGVPDDIARVALFCASDLAIYMSGHTLLVDAGLTA